MPPKKSAPRKTKKPTAKKTTNPWIVHVKKTMNNLGITYTEALKKAKLTYKKI